MILFGEGDERERIEGPGFRIVRILCVEVLECVGIGLNPCLVRKFAFLKETGCGFEKALLPDVRGAELPRLLDLLAAFVQVLVIREIPNLFIDGHSLAPMQGWTFRPLAQSFRESLRRFGVLKRMHKRDALGDGGLCLRRAAIGKDHASQMACLRSSESELMRSAKQQGGDASDQKAD